MPRHVIVAGTGFEGRAAKIRSYCTPGARVTLRREPNNCHDPNAIAVYMAVPRLFGLFERAPFKIGYIKADAAKGLAKRMDKGFAISGCIASFYAPPGREHPRVSLELDHFE